jgi:hypothetical protein
LSVSNDSSISAFGSLLERHQLPDYLLGKIDF